jgi:molybdopterin/thiamine biosynthesis adenylyltransferase
MRMVVLEDLIASSRKMLSGKKKSISLYGRLYAEEDLCQIFNLDTNPGLKKVGTARKQDDEIYFHVAGEQKSLRDIEVIPFQSEYASRAEGIVDTEMLNQKLVALVGIGSVGSVLAVYLAEASVGRFRLIDMEHFSAANVSRHACDLYHLGRHKTKAVSDLIKARNPRIQVDSFEEDFLTLSFESQASMLADADLVIASTDSNACQFAVNEVCLHLKLPSMYVGCYERAHAGEVLYVIPGLTPCFNCVMEFRSHTLGEIKTRERRIPYSDEKSAGFQAEPGLAIDIGYVTSVAAAFALALLAPGSRGSALLDPTRNLVMLHAGSQPESPYNGLFDMPFDYVCARIKRDRQCELCHGLHQSGV